MERLTYVRQPAPGSLVSDVLELLARSINPALVFLARLEGDELLVVRARDRASTGMREGDRIPLCDSYDPTTLPGALRSIVMAQSDAERDDPPHPVKYLLDVGAYMGVPLYRSDGQFYGVFCTVHPRTRTGEPGELALLAHAGRMVMHAVEDEELRDALGRPSAGSTDGKVVVQREIEELRKSEEHYRRLAETMEQHPLHDALTGLPNRTLLLDRLQQAVRVARRNGEPLTLLRLDLNRFKDVNDTLGHHVGDLLLQQVGQRLESTLRESDTVARLDGDEFALVLSGVDDPSAALAATKIVALFQQPFELEGQTITIEARVGTALYPDQGEDATSLLQRAEEAMIVARGAHPIANR